MNTQDYDGLMRAKDGLREVYNKSLTTLTLEEYLNAQNCLRQDIVNVKMLSTGGK